LASSIASLRFLLVRLCDNIGAFGPFLIENMRRLGVDPLSIDAIVISHEHYDHTSGLGAILDMGITPKVYIPATFSKALKDNLNSRIKLIEVDDHTTVFPGLSLICVQGPIVEEALVAETAEGSVVITGCAHPGVANMVKASQAVMPGKVALLVGGFHLLQTRDKNSLESVAEELRGLGVERVLPTHCTSAKAIGVFKDVFGDRALEGGVGRLIECPPTRAASR
jgi:7,8-dihydropterin-6-yl-methyl-4-(beta-D-ribofuranosyl)aminobenzene 5'-phosphate synthase